MSVQLDLFGKGLIKLRPSLFKMARRYYWNLEPEDLVQETILRAWEAQKDFTVIEGRTLKDCLQAWVFRILHNAAALKFRRSVSNMRAVQLTDAIISLHPSHDDPFMVTFIHQAVERFTFAEKQVAVFNAVAVRGMGYAETAAEFGISEGAAYLKVHRARKMLAAQMAEMV